MRLPPSARPAVMLAYPLPESVRAASDSLWASVTHGPQHATISDDEARATLRDWSDMLPSDLWYDIESGEVLESEPVDDPETGDQPLWEDFWRFGPREVVRLVLGDVVAEAIL